MVLSNFQLWDTASMINTSLYLMTILQHFYYNHVTALNWGHLGARRCVTPLQSHLLSGNSVYTRVWVNIFVFWPSSPAQSLSPVYDCVCLYHFLLFQIQINPSHVYVMVPWFGSLSECVINSLDQMSGVRCCGGALSFALTAHLLRTELFLLVGAGGGICWFPNSGAEATI